MSNSIDYRALKDNIIKALSQTKPESMEFKVDYEKLNNIVSDFGLTLLPIGLIGKRVKPENIPYLSEYFEKSNLSWFTENKYFTAIIFIDNNYVDEKAKKLIENLLISQVENPDDDKVNDVAKLVAEYPCYFTTIVSYQNNNPKRVGKPSYVMSCRANKVVIKSSDYQYDPKDFS